MCDASRKVDRTALHDGSLKVDRTALHNVTQKVDRTALHNATQKVNRTPLHDASRKAAPLPVPTQQVSQITKPIDMGWIHAQLHPFLKLISLPPGAYGTPYAYFIEGNTWVTC
jgi:hypothetical protein